MTISSPRPDRVLPAVDGRIHWIRSLHEHADADPEGVAPPSARAASR
jgi:hypothetical protein